MKNVALGVLVGRRGFFPERLTTAARKDVLDILAKRGVEAVILSDSDTRLGAVCNFAEAKKCAELFNANRAKIGGVLVVLPDFGDERAVADTLKLADLNVPVLVQACPDDPARLGPDDRCDSFCGKISVCNNLRQYDIPFSLPSRHTMALTGSAFGADLDAFLGVCRVVKGLRGARLGAIGARTTAFNTVRYSEKILQDSGITVVTMDLSEVFGQAGFLRGDDPRIAAAVEEIRGYADASDVPADKLDLLARLAVVVRGWMEANELDATGIQCWSSIQQNYGINACAVMSLLSERMMPSACEVDITGALTMYAMQLACGSPSALADWNNNYGEDPDKCVLFHCGNWARSFVPDALICHPPVSAEVPAKEIRSWGTIFGRTPAGPFTYARISTDDIGGEIRTYVGEGRFTNDLMDTYGCAAVGQVHGMQKLMKYICNEGFEHHVAMTASRTAAVLAEAFENYMGWEVYYHGKKENED